MSGMEKGWVMTTMTISTSFHEVCSVLTILYFLIHGYSDGALIQVLRAPVNRKVTAVTSRSLET